MTSVRPARPSELATLRSRQSVWLTVTLYISTASLWKIKCASVCVCVCVRVFTVRADAATADGVSVGVGGPMSSVLLSVGPPMAERQASDTCNIVTSELSWCLIRPVERGHIANMLVGV